MTAHEIVTLNRNEAVEIANIWGHFVARLLRDEVERNPHGAARKVSREMHGFIEAVCRRTENPFLRGHAQDFAKALEEGLFGESLKRLLTEDKAVQKQQSQQARRREIKIHQPVVGQVADGGDKGHRTLSLRRPEPHKR